MSRWKRKSSKLKCKQLDEKSLKIRNKVLEHYLRVLGHSKYEYKMLDWLLGNQLSGQSIMTMDMQNIMF